MSKLAADRNVDIAYLDFVKAFDIVDRSILLDKIKKGNFWPRPGVSIDFLNIRVQQVRIGPKLSREAPLRSGVPLGSVLWALLFLFFSQTWRSTYSPKLYRSSCLYLTIR